MFALFERAVTSGQIPMGARQQILPKFANIHPFVVEELGRIDSNVCGNEQLVWRVRLNTVATT
jgi:hypothetical protein